ncbi:MAG: DUF4190 domain-containing protein [Clostridiales Family XIII bacterium]|nr:DUF4190 domain-containing protein [Clostridiales Family XIII bacterium]
MPYAQSGYNFGQENNAGQPNGQAIASMVLGIVGVLCIFSTALVIPAPIGVILGIIALILGINAKKKQPSGMATAGIVLGIVSIVFCLLGFIACVACGLAGLGALAGL